MDMDYLTDVLQSWNIPEDIVNNFVRNGITVELLPKLTEENLKELFPHICPTRLILKEKNDELVTAHATTEANSSTSIVSDSCNNTSLIIALDNIEDICQSIARKSFSNFDLETLLHTSAGDNNISKYYETYGYLDNTKRNQLVDIYIVNCPITYEEYNVLAAKIITLFPKESTGTYFTKPIPKRNSLNGRSTIARGKLVDKVRNLLYKYGDRKRPSTSDAETELRNSHDCL